MNGVKASLERKLGPLPAWAWALVGGTVLYWWRNRNGAAAAASSQTAPAAGGSYPASSGPPAGAGKPVRFPKRKRKPKRPRKPKPPRGHRPHPHPKPKLNPKRLIPGRKRHPHDRLLHRHPARGPAKNRTAGAKAALTASVRAFRPQAPAHPAHDRPAVRGRLHAAPVRVRGPLAAPSAVHLVPSSSRGLAGVSVGHDRAAVTRQPPPSAPAQASARRSHADAPAHQDAPPALRPRVEQAAPSAGAGRRRS